MSLCSNSYILDGFLSWNNLCFYVYLPVHPVSQVGGQVQSPGYIYRPDSSYVLGNPIPGVALSSWSYNSVPSVTVSQMIKGIICSCCIFTSSKYFVTWFVKNMNVAIILQHVVLSDDVGLAGRSNSQNFCYSSGNDSTLRTWPVGETIDRGDQGKPPRGCILVLIWVVWALRCRH